VTDATILKLVRSGNRLGIKGLYDKYAVQFLHFIKKVMPHLHHEKAQEVILHVIIRTWINRRHLPDSESKLYPWMVSLLHKEVKRYASLPG
jgi:hypothetical protein